MFSKRNACLLKQKMSSPESQSIPEDAVTFTQGQLDLGLEESPVATEIDDQTNTPDSEQQDMESEANSEQLSEEETLVTVTLNAYNLRRPKKNASEKDRLQYQSKLLAFAEHIDEIEADVVALQEIFDDGSLDDLTEVVGQVQERKWNFSIADKGDSRGIHTAIISPYEIKDAHDIVEMNPALPEVRSARDSVVTRLGRAALAATVEVEGIDVDIVAAHLKSQLDIYEGGRQHTSDMTEEAVTEVSTHTKRLYEAGSLRIDVATIIDGKGNEKPVVVMGDLNADRDAPSTKVLLGPDGSEMGTSAAEKPDKGDADRLFNMTEVLPEGEDWTIKHGGEGHVYDHILATNALRKALVEGSVSATSIPKRQVTLKNGKTFEFEPADHRSVRAEFSLPKLREIVHDTEADDAKVVDLATKRSKRKNGKNDDDPTAARAA